jgi:N6-L-threonylcarbamoyladenine synthase
MIILAIETSCDETSVAVVTAAGEVRSNLIASQIARHRPFGGVVPEIASREHLDHLQPLIRQALDQARVTLADLGLIAVTNGPGLIGALLVGVAGAQGLSYALSIPLAPVNHLEGHIFSPWLRSEGAALERPSRFWSVVVSGGHSSVYDVGRNDAGAVVRMLNKTRDDAAGEVLDKVAKVIGMPYPGGPEIERAARSGHQNKHAFQVARMKNDSLDFSFSGLKSMAIRTARELGVTTAADGSLLADFAASFQRAVVDQIIARLDRLWDEADQRPEELGLAGGVAANTLLRERLAAWGTSRGLIVRLPEKIFCTDNAAMIAFAALNRGPKTWGDPRRVQAYSRAPGTEKGPPKPSSLTIV